MNAAESKPCGAAARSDAFAATVSSHRFQGGIGGPAWAFILLLTLLRVAYLGWFCPYELAADEAQYWDWSRPGHLSLSYYSKGPGIAWLIAASTRLFGDAEWVVRLPAALSMGAAMLAVAALAGRLAGPRAALAGAAAFFCVPAYHATALLMTIDAPYIACWAGAAAAAWVLRERAACGQETLGWWVALALVAGVGFLFKYTIILLPPGLLLWAWIGRRAVRVSAGTAARAFAAGLVFAAIVSPVMIWNQRHGWPTLSHLLGHLGAAGGDVPGGGAARSFDPRWPLEFLGAQIGMIGPMLVLMGVAAQRCLVHARAAVRDSAVFALATAGPILLFYLGVSFFTDAEANWPIAGYTMLLVPVAVIMGTGGTSANGAARSAWRIALWYGTAGFIGLMGLAWLDRVPGLTNAIPYHRISGHGAYAASVEAVRAEVGEGALVIADQYTRAALLAYYLPDRPRVCSATSFLGGRRSSYDYFADTSLHDPSLTGRDAVLVGATPEKWMEAFGFEAVEVRAARDGKRAAIYLGRDYKGPTPR